MYTLIVTDCPSRGPSNSACFECDEHDDFCWLVGTHTVQNAIVPSFSLPFSVCVSSLEW